MCSKRKTQAGGCPEYTSLVETLEGIQVMLNWMGQLLNDALRLSGETTDCREPKNPASSR